MNETDVLKFCEACFNRYMVECECIYTMTLVNIKFSFNRYMVECE